MRDIVAPLGLASRKQICGIIEDIDMALRMLYMLLSDLSPHAIAVAFWYNNRVDCEL